MNPIRYNGVSSRTPRIQPSQWPSAAKKRPTPDRAFCELSVTTPITPATIQTKIASEWAPRAYASPPIAAPISVLTIAPSAVGRSGSGRWRNQLPRLIVAVDKEATESGGCVGSVCVTFSEATSKQPS